MSTPKSREDSAIPTDSRETSRDAQPPTAPQTGFPGPTGLPSSEALVIPETRGCDPVRPSLLAMNRHAVPGYEILGLLGHGGMGVVYLARQNDLDRLVALKMIVSGPHAGPEDVARFLQEAQHVARLKHPNIVHIHHTGEVEGKPFFSMEYLDGGTLAEKIHDQPLPPRSAAQLVETLARAIHHAHVHRVIHRDLKPSNVLLTAPAPLHAAPDDPTLEGGEVRLGQPKITDFGLAKRLDEAGHTAHGAILGTPNYMAPEQAEGRSRDIGPAVDIYAMGAMLYEVLTGRPPFLAATLAETLRKVREDEPVPPRQLEPRTPCDLETICLKCLRKEPKRRYASALDLADDLNSFLSGKPIKARPVSAWERARKWVRRQPLAAGLIALVVLGMVLGVAGAIWHSWRMSDALSTSQHHEYVSEIRLAELYFKDRQLDQADHALDLCPPHLRQWEWHYLKRLCRLEVMPLRGHASQVTSVDYSPDGSRVATADEDGRVIVWDARTGQQLLVAQERGDWINVVRFVGDGCCLVTAGEDEVVRVFDLNAGRKRDLPVKGTRLSAARDKGVHRIAVVGRDREQTIFLLDLDTDRETIVGRSPDGTVSSIALSPDGNYLAAYGLNLLHKIWDTRTGREVAIERPKELGPWLDPGWSIPSTFSADSRLIALGGADLSVWDISERKFVRSFTGTGHSPCCSVSLSPDGLRLAASYRDGFVRVWDVKSGKTVRAPARHGGIVPDLAFSPSGEYLAVPRGREVTLERLYPKEVPPCRILKGHENTTLETLAFCPDGQRLASVAGLEILLHDVEGEAKPRRLHAHADKTGRAGLAFTSDGILLSCQNGSAIEAWDAEGRNVPRRAVPAGEVLCLALSRDGLGLATASKEKSNRIVLWDARDGRQVRSWMTPGPVFSLAFDPRGKLLASYGSDGTVILWDIAKGKEVQTIRGHRGLVACAAFSPDGKRLATAGADLTARVWDVANGQLLFTLSGHSGYVAGVAYSPDGRRLASCGIDGTIKLWDAATGEEVFTLSGHDGYVAAVAFSPDGRLLASCGRDGTVRIWDARPLNTD